MKVQIGSKTAKHVKLLALGDRSFMVLEAFRVIYKTRRSARVYQIPVNFQTDLGTVPRLLRWVISVASAPVAFVAHDFLYRSASGISRREADAVMLALMEYTNAPKSKIQRRLAWAGVRAGGFFSFKK
jgi:hypothetical protein